MVETMKTDLSKNEQIVLPAIQKSFVARVRKLTEDGVEIVTAYAKLSQKMLSFASSFKALTDEARQLDKADDGVHSQYLRSQLAETIGSHNPDGTQ